MLTKDIEVGKRYRTADGTEVVISRREDWTSTESKKYGATYTVFYNFRDNVYPICVFGNGTGRGTGYYSPQLHPEKHNIVEEIEEYEQIQLDLFGE